VAGLEALADGLQGLARFVFSRARQQGIVKILPQVSVLIQINDHGGFVTAIIHDVADAAHGNKIGQFSEKSSLDFPAKAICHTFKLFEQVDCRVISLQIPPNALS
jgi:hypothetical protein